MEGSLSDDQLLLQATVRRLAADGASWRVLCDGGFTAMLLPERVGGSASSLLDMVVVVEALATALTPGPFLGSAVLASSMLMAAEADDAVLAALAGGHTTAAVAVTPDLVELQRLSPESEGVAWDCGPTPLFVALDGDGEHVLGCEDPSSDVIEAFDLGRRFVRCWRDDDQVWRPLGKLDAESHSRWATGALIAVSAEMCGVMAGALDSAVRYAGERKQFDQPIGSFQAVQHLCAQAHVRLEASRSAVYAAADRSASEDIAVALERARAVKAYVNDSVRFVTEAALQVHGGIGMTWEFAGHHYLRRAWMDAQTFGGSLHHLTAIAGRLLRR